MRITEICNASIKHSRLCCNKECITFSKLYFNSVSTFNDLAFAQIPIVKKMSTSTAGIITIVIYLFTIQNKTGLTQ